MHSGSMGSNPEMYLLRFFVLTLSLARWRRGFETCQSKFWVVAANAAAPDSGPFPAMFKHSRARPRVLAASPPGMGSLDAGACNKSHRDAGQEVPGSRPTGGSSTQAMVHQALDMPLLTLHSLFAPSLTQTLTHGPDLPPVAMLLHCSATQYPSPGHASFFAWHTKRCTHTYHPLCKKSAV